MQFHKQQTSKWTKYCSKYLKFPSILESYSRNALKLICLKNLDVQEVL